MVAGGSGRAEAVRRHATTVLLRTALVAAALALGLPAAAQQPFFILASTTSTDNSGLFEHLLPRFEASTGIAVRVVARGTGQALQMGRAGDADVLLVHDRQAERAFIAGGFGVARRDVMYNDFVIVGPKDDPAGIRGTTDAAAALTRIAEARATFVSRGDDSGTHRAERRFWNNTGVGSAALTPDWYLEAGAGMGATLNVAVGKHAYTLTDRGTWLSFQNRGDLAVLFEGDPRLFNQYGVMLVNPARHPHVKEAEGRAFIEWLTSPEGQAAIAAFRIGGTQLFFPNYHASAPPSAAPPSPEPGTEAGP